MTEMLVIEIARTHREALEAIRQRMAAQQIGEAFNERPREEHRHQRACPVQTGSLIP